MSDHSGVGKALADLREAIVSGFNTESLDMILRDNDLLSANVASGPSFAVHVKSLIEVAHKEGWLIKLCNVLADARRKNKPVYSAITFARQRLSNARGAEDHLILSITSNLTVAEETVDLALEMDGKAATIEWPRSSDQLLDATRASVKTFDEDHITLEGAEQFARDASSAIASCIRFRNGFQKRLPDLIRRLQGLENSHKRQAVVGYLLLANYVTHQPLAALSSWEGSLQLDFQIPAAWVPFRNLPMNEAVPKLLGPGKVRMYGLYRVDSFLGVGPKVRMYVPPGSMSSQKAVPLVGRPYPNESNELVIYDKELICRWLVPQIEIMDEQGGVPRMPGGYSVWGWVFFDVKQPSV